MYRRRDCRLRAGWRGLLENPPKRWSLSCRLVREVPRERQKIGKERVTVLRGDAFRMKLHAMHGMGLVHHALDHAVLAGGGDFEAAGHGRRIDGQGMIAGGEKVIVEAAEHRLAGVMNAAELAMHGFG